MSKKKSKAPNWSKALAAGNGMARPETPASRAAEALHRSLGALLARPGLPRLGVLAPIEVALGTASDCAPSGTVHVAVDIRADEVHPTALLVTTGPASFQQLVAWIYGRTDDDLEEEGPPLVVRDAQLMSLSLIPVRELVPSERRAQLGEALVLDGVPRAWVASHLTHRRVGLAPDAEELAVLAEVVESLTRALGDPGFEALPYSYDDATCTRVAVDGSTSEVAWPELSHEVRESLLTGQDDGDLWDEVDDEARTALERDACALSDALDGAQGRSILVTAQPPYGEADGDLGALLFLEPGTLRELARRELGSAPGSDDPPASVLVRALDLVLDVLEGNTDLGPNAWRGGAPRHVIHELEELHGPLLALLGDARVSADRSAVDVELSETDQAAARYLNAREHLSRAPLSPDADAQRLAGALAYIEHRSEHVAAGGEVNLLTFLDDEDSEQQILHGGVQEGRIAGARSFRLLCAISDGTGEAAWLPQLLTSNELPETFERGFAAWAAAAPDFYVREAGGATFRALGAGTTGVPVPMEVLDDLPDFEAEAAPLWRARLGAAECFVPAGRPLPVSDARALLARVEATRGALDDAARHASAALIVRHTFVR